MELMLVARVELWERGDPARARELGCVGLANVSSLAPVSSYLVVRVEEGQAIRDGIVHGHRRADGFWPLLREAMSDTLSDDLPPAALGTLLAMSERLQYGRRRPGSQEGTSS